jgi:hypothetical protein
MSSRTRVFSFCAVLVLLTFALGWVAAPLFPHYTGLPVPAPRTGFADEIALLTHFPVDEELEPAALAHAAAANPGSPASARQLHADSDVHRAPLFPNVLLSRSHQKAQPSVRRQQHQVLAEIDDDTSPPSSPPSSSSSTSKSASSTSSHVPPTPRWTYSSPRSGPFNWGQQREKTDACRSSLFYLDA